MVLVGIIITGTIGTGMDIMEMDTMEIIGGILIIMIIERVLTIQAVEVLPIIILDQA